MYEGFPVMISAAVTVCVIALPLCYSEILNCHTSQSCYPQSGFLKTLILELNHKKNYLSGVYNPSPILTKGRDPY